ncbi:molecular chaperone HscC [Pseudomonas sp. RW409]|uniref:molecular chaperone HscC n=1 Tax=Pseudomonas sp. RW409 TaxID=2202895 RepID=UPI000D733321|nr:molecular chaperone HscC [Pseudomonas sp. RW409]PWY37441.1 molecular chaperone HscC [Pseudomonas sp. RW409]
MIVGIDLGTTNSLIAVWREGAPHLVGNALDRFLTPSVVGLDDQGRILVGQAAKERLQTHPKQTVSLFKRHMGSAQEVRLGEKLFRPEELSALVLRSLKEDVERHYGETVTEAVISVPAYFNDAQRKATKIAGELAGLKVERLINEPTAAALAYGLHQRDNASSFLVFDLGGGTFDVSILELFDGVMEVRASAGDNFLGGEDFDTLLVQAFLSGQASAANMPKLDDPNLAHRLRREAERVRHALGNQETATFSLHHGALEWSKTFTQEQLAELYAPLLTRLRTPIETALRDARIRPSELDEVLLVGGTTRMPMIRRMVAGLFGRFPSIQLDPDQSIALGAAVQAALKARDAALEEVVLTDVCPYTLGVEIANSVAGSIESGHFLPIIERNNVVPVSKVKSVSTLHDRQKQVQVKIYQGESRWVKDNVFLGEMDIAVPPAPAGEVSLQVRFTYDNNGLLEAEVHIPLTGETRSLVIENNPGVLDPKQIKARLAELADLKIHPREQQVNSLLIARLERLYQESLGDLRQQLDQMASHFQHILESQDERLIRENRLQMTRHLDELEQGLWR